MLCSSLLTLLANFLAPAVFILVVTGEVSTLLLLSENEQRLLSEVTVAASKLRKSDLGVYK